MRKKRREGSLNYITWISVEKFIECLFRYKKFDDDRPIFLNRHWILHGRDNTDWEIGDSLRLFNALNTISQLT